MFNPMKLEAKIRKLTPEQLVMAMVEGLREPHVTIKMETFGNYDADEKICYGCAATNAIAGIHGGIKPLIKSGGSWHCAAKVVSSKREPSGELTNAIRFISDIENAFDYLRRGDVEACNDYLLMNDMAPLRQYAFEHLPRLDDDYADDQLDVYEQFARFQSEAA